MQHVMCMVATSRIDPDLCFLMLQFYLATDMYDYARY